MSRCVLVYTSFDFSLPLPGTPDGSFVINLIYLSHWPHPPRFNFKFQRASLEQLHQLSRYKKKKNAWVSFFFPLEVVVVYIFSGADELAAFFEVEIVWGGCRAGF